MNLSTRKFNTAQTATRRNSDLVLAVNQYVDLGERQTKRRRIDNDENLNGNNDDTSKRTSNEVTVEEVQKILQSHLDGGNIITKKNVWQQRFDIKTFSLRDRNDNFSNVDFTLAASALHLAGDIYMNQVDDTHKGTYSLLSSLSNTNVAQQLDEEHQEKVRQRKRKAAKTLADNPEDLDLKETLHSFNFVRFHHGISDFEISKPECFLTRILGMDRKGNLNLDRRNFFPFQSITQGDSLNTSQCTFSPSRRVSDVNLLSSNQFNKVDQNSNQNQENQGEIEMNRDLHHVEQLSHTLVSESPFQSKGDIGIDIELPNISYEENNASVLDIPIESDDEEEVPIYETYNLDFENNNNIQDIEQLANNFDENQEFGDRDDFGYFKEVNLRALPQLRSSSKPTVAKNREKNTENLFVDFSSYKKTLKIPKISIEKDPSKLTQKEKTQQTKKKISKLDIISLNFDFTRDLLTPFNFTTPLDWNIERSMHISHKNPINGEDAELPYIDPLPDFDAIEANMSDIRKSQDQEQEFSIDRPEEISKIDINFSTNSKRVDIAAVKDSMKREIDKTDMVTFSSLVQKSRSEIADFSENMSVGINFICLLHLTNQYGYLIEQKEPFGDFMINHNPNDN